MAFEKQVLVTGSSGLIGSEAASYFHELGWRVWGLDNNLRRTFFGAAGDTSWNLAWQRDQLPRFTHLDLDIRDRTALLKLFADTRLDLIVHCAAQPSHDLAAQMPFEDWDVNAVGTFNLLEAARRHCAESPFILMSTNKVYGDAPNALPLVELETRYDYARPFDRNGIDESCPIDQCLHSLFGASKAAADLAAQEYGRYFGMPVGIFRGGCLTGSRHSGVQLHGFLSYLVKVAVHGKPYTIFGYQGKQVRDNIHSRDVVRAFHHFSEHPRPGEVYNLGGGRDNSTSIMEAIRSIERLSGRTIDCRYDATPRRGDHVCYITDLGKFRRDYPDWELTTSLEDTLAEMISFEQSNSAEPAASAPRRSYMTSVRSP